MLQYIINMTAIWLMSLVFFDLFLHRESYHGYNRAYLLSTFVMGILLPLWQWENDTVLYTASVQVPITRVINAKQNIVAVSTAATPVNREQWIVMIYVAGAIIAMGWLLTDVVKLYMLSAKGKRKKQGSWTIIETGKEHAPFSIRNTLYVCSRQQYGNDEWNMILEHERKHTTLLHFADLVLMQLARIVFWFHPLVYVYNKRLLMVHEYQADVASAKERQVYGRFLVEQAMLQHAPSITHSFNRSPIKNRIAMLHRRSSEAAKAKMLVFVPLAVVCTLCFSRNSFSQGFKREGNIVTYKGNKFELGKEKIDTLTIIDPIAGNEIVKYIKAVPRPEKMNGKVIHTEITKAPSYTGKDKTLRTYLLKGLTSEFSGLEDGMYRLDVSSVLINEKGKVVYFKQGSIIKVGIAKSVKDLPATATITQSPDMKVTVQGNSPMGNGPFTVSRINNPDDSKEIDKKIQEDVAAKIYSLMDAVPKFDPAKLNGKKVAAYYEDMSFFNSFKIKDHKVYIQYDSYDYVPL